MAGEAAHKAATYADLLAAPEHLVAELIDGRLETQPRPFPKHAQVAVELSVELGAPYGRGRGGPGGWIFMAEPELHLGRHVLVPDIAGWRSERLAGVSRDEHISIAPDWACEILSKSTRRKDLGPKRRIYGEFGVAHLWFIDPDERALEAFTLIDGLWTLLAFLDGDDEVRVSPFDAISFKLPDLFPFDTPST